MKGLLSSEGDSASEKSMKGLLSREGGSVLEKPRKDLVSSKWLVACEEAEEEDSGVLYSLNGSAEEGASFRVELGAVKSACGWRLPINSVLAVCFGGGGVCEGAAAAGMLSETLIHSNSMRLG